MSDKLDDVLNKLELAITNYVNYCVNNEVEPLVSYVSFHGYNIRFYSFKPNSKVSGALHLWHNDERGSEVISFIWTDEFKWIR